jgi:hypothetical protein
LGNDVDLSRILGASPQPAGERFTIYLPDKDRLGEPVKDINSWIDAALYLLTEINGGATKLAPTTGYWRSPQGQTVTEQTTLVYSYYRDPQAFHDRLDEIAAFLHDFGRSTNQGEIVAEIFGESQDGFFNRFYSITEFRAE